MKLLSKKIPRGVIYHSLGQSLRFLAAALFAPLGRQAKVAEMEKAFARYCGRKHCVAFPFARTAIYFALKDLGLPKGSEVLMPPITIKAIVDAVLDLGLVPVYLDLDPETLGFRPEDLTGKIGPKVKAALLTPLFGLAPDLPAMVSRLKEQGVFVLEDFSHCLNARFGEARVGNFGDLGIYSSSSIKTLDTLGGGLAVTDDDGIERGLRAAQASLSPSSRVFLVKKAWINLVRNLATRQPIFSLLTFPLLQFIRSLDPGAALKQTGHRNKDRLAALPPLWFRAYSSVQAAIGLELIQKVVQEDRARIANVEAYRSTEGIQGFPSTLPGSHNVYWQCILPVPDPFEAQVFLAGEGIDCATSSLELVCALEAYPNRADLPNAARIYRNGILVPCYPALTQKDRERVEAALRKFFRERVHVRN